MPLQNLTSIPDAFERASWPPQTEINHDYSNRSYGRDVIGRLARNKGALISFICIFLILCIAIIAPLTSPYSYQTVNTNANNLPPRVPGLEKLGIFDGTNKGVDMYRMDHVKNQYHYFGTDNLGRDIWTRVWVGTRLSLFIAGIAVFIDVCIGVVYGMVSGYLGGKLDIVLQRITEVMSSIPTMVVVTLLIFVLKPGLMNIIIALMLTGWINMSRIVRAQVLKLKNQEFVLAAKTLGAGTKTILFKEILPNTLGQIVITFMFSIPNAIFLEAFLAFIGLGVPAPFASLGSLINDGYKSAMIYPYMVFFPIIVLGILMLCFNLFADSLRDAIDPQMKQM